MVGHSNLGFAEALRRAEERGELTLHRHPARGRRRLRRERLRQAHRPARPPASRSPARARPTCSPACTTPSSTSAPVVAISGQVPSKVLGRGAFQDLDLSAVFKDVAISTHDRAGGQRPRRAGGPGGQARRSTAAASPTWCCPTRCRSLPSERRRQVPPDGRYAGRRDPARRRRPGPGAPTLVARRPAPGARSSGTAPRGAQDEVVALAERLNAPVLTTFKAKGLVPDTHPLGAGVLGRSGTPVASWLMNESDLLIVVGASFSNHTGIAPYKPIVQIDDDHDRDRPVRRRHRRRPRRRRDSSLAGADRQPSRTPRPRTSAPTSPSAGRSGGPRRRAGSTTTAAAACRRRPCSPRCPSTCPRTPSSTVDVGNHAYSLGRYLESKGQPVLMSGYLGSIGFGYPAALGAWAADPGRPIVAVTGDGGFGQYATELTTAVKYGIPIKHVLLDNNALGKISKEQLAADYPVWHTSLQQPRLGGVRRALRRDRDPGHPPRPARRRDDRTVRHRPDRPCSASSRTPNCSDAPTRTTTRRNHDRRARPRPACARCSSTAR